MKIITTVIISLICLSSFGQNDSQAIADEARPIVEEGKMLYHSEMASWYGTDLFLMAYNNRENIGGYFSYSENDTSRCVFFSKGDTVAIIGTISFDSTYNTETAIVSIEEREFSKTEQDLYEIRLASLTAIRGDTMFKMYENTNYNIIPLIHKGEKKVYVLTGPQQTGVVIFGNDYLITFNEENEVTMKKPLHKNIIPLYYGGDEDGKTAMHTHLPETGDLITATDICTLMLYSKFTDWESHSVVSEKYMSTWSCKTSTLIIVPMSDVKKIAKDQKKKDRKKKKKQGLR